TEVAVTLAAFNRTEESARVAKSALSLFPSDQFLRFFEALALPVLYEAPTQIAQYRRRFSMGLDRLIAGVELVSEEARRAALKACGQHNNFYLAYQGNNDRELQQAYGGLVHRIMAANHPKWVQPLEMPLPGPGGKLRVGYLSEEFRSHTVAKLFKGWL